MSVSKKLFYLQDTNELTCKKVLHEVVCKRSHSSVRGWIKSMASSNLACC